MSDNKHEKNEPRIEHEYTSEIICPWCGIEYINSWEVETDLEDWGLQRCENCEHEFYAMRYVTVEYSTRKATYGTCLACSNANVVIETGYDMYAGKYAELCGKCKNDCIRVKRDEYIAQFRQTLTRGMEGSK